MNQTTPAIADGSVWHLRGAESVKFIVADVRGNDVHFIRPIVTGENQIHNYQAPELFLRDHEFVAETASPEMFPNVDLEPVVVDETWAGPYQSSKLVRVTHVTSDTVRYRSLGCPDAPCKELDIWTFRHRYSRQP